jgi:hypothetical protein
VPTTLQLLLRLRRTPDGNSDSSQLAIVAPGATTF